jgi:hypothetical protein
VQLPFFNVKNNLNYALKLNQTNNPNKNKTTKINYLQNPTISNIERAPGNGIRYVRLFVKIEKIAYFTFTH